MYISVFYEHILEAAEQEKLPVEEVLRLIKEYHIRGVELDYGRINKKEAEKQRICSQLAEQGIDIHGIYGFFDFGKTTDYLPGTLLVEEAVQIGAKSVLLIPGFIDDRTETKAAKEEIINMKSAVAEIAKRGKEAGILVAMEDFDDCKAPFSTASQLLSFMEEIPELVCAFDTGNFLYSEEDVLQAFELLAPYIQIVHCKDRSFQEKDGEESKLTIKERAMYSSPVGYGDIPMAQLISLLKSNAAKRKIGDTAFVIEHFGSKHQLADMKKSAEWLLAQ